MNRRVQSGQYRPRVRQPNDTIPLLGRNKTSYAGMGVGSVLVGVILTAGVIVSLILSGLILGNVTADDTNNQFVNMDLLSTIDNVPDAFQGGGVFFPADPILAVGPSSIITMVNVAATILDKETHTTIAVNSDGSMFKDTFQYSFGDPWIQYDEFAKRFIAVVFNPCSSNVAITLDGLGAPISGRIANFGPQTFSPISGSFVESVPADGCTPLTNAGAINGNIAVISRGACNFVTKVANAEAAGATAVIVYNVPSREQLCSFGMGGSDPNITIPSMSITNADSVGLLGALPDTGTISPLSTSEWNTNIFLAVSKDSEPTTLDSSSWHQYDILEPFYNGSFVDFPKIGIDQNNLYISTIVFKPNSTWDGIDFSYEFDTVTSNANILSISKSSILEGGNITILGTQELSISTHEFMWPARTRPPVGDFYQSMYFVSLAGGILIPGTPEPTGIRILRTDPFSIDGSGLPLIETDLPLSLPISYLPSGFGLVSELGLGAPQPESDTLGPQVPLDVFPSIQTVIHRGNSLYAAFSYRGEKQWHIRWVEIDISADSDGTIFSVPGDISIAQEGDIVGENEESLFYPAMEVDNDGNIAISFSVSGPNTYPSIGYTGRHNDDPLGTMRYPYTISKTGRYSQESAFGLRNRWGDYSGLSVCPIDGKTFYSFNMIADPTAAIAPDVSFIWTTALSSFKIEQSNTKPGVVTHPEARIGTQRITPIVTTRGSPSKNTRNEQEGEEERVIPFEDICHKFEEMDRPMPGKCTRIMADMEENPDKYYHDEY